MVCALTGYSVAISSVSRIFVFIVFVFVTNIVFYFLSLNGMVFLGGWNGCMCLFF